MAITIGDKNYELKKLNVGEWLEIAKIYDDMPRSEETNVGYIESRLKIIGILFGLSEEDTRNLPAEDIIPLYVKGYQAFQNILSSKLDQKKIEEGKTAEN